MTFDENIRLVATDAPEYVARLERSPAQQVRDEILETAERKFTEARDLVVEGLEMFELLATPQHRNLTTLLHQQIMQVIEYRRVHQ